MKLFIKELKGNEVALEGIENETLIVDIKKQIEAKLNIPGRCHHYYFRVIKLLLRVRILLKLDLDNK